MFSLALPVVLADLGWMSMGAIDTMMVGRVSAEATGAVSIGRVFFLSVAVLGIGSLLGLDTIISFAYGARRIEDCRRSLLHGIYLSFAISLPLALLVRMCVPLLVWLGIEPGVLQHAGPYLRALSWSMLPLLLYTTFRRYLQAVNRVRPVMIALASASLITVGADWALVFGRLGVQPMGAEGAGWVTCISSCYMALFLLVAVLLHQREELQQWRFSLRPEAQRFRAILRLGLPAAFQLVLEVGVFAAATGLAGRLDAVSLAAHQIALTAASLSYMVPLGVSSAAAVRVAQALGRNDAASARRAGFAALTLGTVFMTAAALCFLALPRPLMKIFTNEPAVIAVGVRLLAVAALFQLFDGLQVVATGALRGAGDTRTPLVWSAIGHWALGLPIGYFLCFVRGWGVVGLWTGWLAALALVGLALLGTWSRRAHALAERFVSAP